LVRLELGLELPEESEAHRIVGKRRMGSVGIEETELVEG
jgi:hypothetical protein